MDTTWLGELEDRVKQAGEEIERLRLENRDLKKKLRRRDQRAAPGSGPSNADWLKEREDLRDRVGRLVQGLDELLES